jgi:segregation and condensation protein B
MLTPPAALHALLFASGEPLQKKEAAKLLGIKEAELAISVKALAQSLAQSGVVLVETATEIELRTAPDAADIVKRLRESELARDLGKGSLETLAVIAYRESATRSDIDWVRGVNSTASLRTLLMRGLIEGKEDEKDKRRIRYTLTTEALAHLGLTSAGDLPRFEELRGDTAAVLVEKDAQPEGETA